MSKAYLRMVKIVIVETSELEALVKRDLNVQGTYLIPNGCCLDLKVVDNSKSKKEPFKKIVWIGNTIEDRKNFNLFNFF